MGTIPPPLTFEITLEQRLALSRIELELPNKTKHELVEAIKSLISHNFVLQNNLINVIRPSRSLTASQPTNLESVRGNPVYREFFNRDT